MNRRRGTIWLLVGLILAFSAAGLSYYVLQQGSQQAAATEEEATQTVVVAGQLINERAVVRLTDVRTEERPIEEVPSGAVFKTEDVIGRIAARSVMPGEILLTQNLIESFPGTELEQTETITGAINFDQSLGEDLVAFALPATDLLSSEGILLPGDLIDLLFSTDVIGAEEGVGGKISIYALQGLEVLQIIYQPPPEVTEEKKDKDEVVEPPPRLPKTLILAITPQDAVVLKYAIDAETPIDLVLRAKDNAQTFEVDTVNINTLSERYNFSAPRPVR